MVQHDRSSYCYIRSSVGVNRKCFKDGILEGWVPFHLSIEAPFSTNYTSLGAFFMWLLNALVRCYLEYCFSKVFRRLIGSLTDALF